MTPEKIDTYNHYINTLHTVGQSTHGRSDTATVDILMPNQIHALPTRLDVAEDTQCKLLEKIFKEQCNSSYIELERLLDKIYNGVDQKTTLHLPTLLSAQEKTALNKKILIKDMVLKAKDNSIQQFLYTKSKELEHSNTIIAILERVLGQDAGTITANEELYPGGPKQPWPSIVMN